MKAITVQDRLSLLRACYRWGIKQGLVKDNPWEDVKLKVPPKQAPKPFTLEEIKLLIKKFRESRYFPRGIADYVEFLFGTGCRSGEAIGLRWKHVTDDCSSCWVGEIVTRNQRKAPKTNRPRTVPLTTWLQEMLLILLFRYQEKRSPWMAESHQSDRLVVIYLHGELRLYTASYWASASGWSISTSTRATPLICTYTS